MQLCSYECNHVCTCHVSLIHKHLKNSNIPVEFSKKCKQLLNWAEVEYIFYLQVELLHNENFIYE